ncbi:MAG: S9 family peptidase [Acidobacteria bacterium]|nr:S9 family peptidase [Acidobacteriota bacterium]
MTRKTLLPSALSAALFVSLIIVAPRARAADGARRVPTVDDLLSLKTLGAARISPDGKWVAYTVSEANFKADAFVTQIWIADTATGRRMQLTRGEKSSANPRWSPDSAWLAFTSDRVGDKSQIFVIRPDGGESVQLTKHETSVAGFDFSPDGRTIIYAATEPPPATAKERKEQYADFEVVRKEYNHLHLWSLAVTDASDAPAVGKQLTKGKEFSVSSFSFSPDSSRVAFSATINPDLIQGSTSDIYVLNLADNSLKKIVNQPGQDDDPHFSPDGTQVVFSTVMGRQPYFATNARLAVVPADGGTPRSITDAFDENANFVEWNRDGLYFSGQQKMSSHLFRLDPSTGKLTRVSAPDNLMAGGFTFTRDGRQLAFTAPSPQALSEIYVTPVAQFAPRAVTEMSEQLKSFVLGTREVVSWKSQDGTTIEGVLIKPADFDPAKKYPLLCIIHGGPTGVDRPTAVDTRTYPADIWVARGALVLKVNYRGSAGYGEKFRTLNVRNLGVGDAWDVLSGVDSLVAKGWVDPSRVGCMGWSQGGYISAFLTASSDRFKAISVGAGISDWATYYYNTDITPFTINYLGKDPVADPDIYKKTSPIAYVSNARTPTLIQHGELDRRVPIANGYELRQALEDRGVPVEMVVYKGFGHGITKPRAQRAVMTHNLVWFNHYIFGDTLPDLANLPLPKKEEKKEGEKAGSN